MGLKLKLVGVVAAAAIVIGVSIAFIKPTFNIQIDMRSPLKGVQVRADDQDFGEIQGGTFEFELARKRNSQVQITLSKNGFKPYNTTLTLDEKTKKLSGIELQIVPIKMDLQIEVKDQRGGPLPGHTVALRSGGEALASGQTDDQGIWTATVAKGLGEEIEVVADGAPARRVSVRRLSEPDTVSITVDIGVPVELTAANRIGGIEVYKEDQLLGQTDAQGKALLSLPTVPENVVLRFELPGKNVRIDSLTISSAQIRAGRKLEHKIKVRPSGPITLDVKVAIEGSQTAVLTGYSLYINGRQKGNITAKGRSITLNDVLVGDVLNVKVAKDNERTGAARIRINPDKNNYIANIVLSVPKSIRLIVTTPAPGKEPLGNVLVKMGGEGRKTDSNGRVEFKIGRLNQEYRFTFERPGYVFGKSYLSLTPKAAVTNETVFMEPLHFIMSLIDSLGGNMVAGIDVVLGGRKLVQTVSIPEKIPISRLGKHQFEFRSTVPEYPTSQTRSVQVRSHGESITVSILPRAVELSLRFLNQATQRPLPDRMVDIRGPGFVERGKTGSRGEIVFKSYALQLQDTCQVVLNLGDGTHEFDMPIKGYVNQVEKQIELCSNIRITSQSDAELKLYNNRAEYRNNPGRPVLSGTGEIVSCKPYGTYFLVAQGQAKIEQTLNVNSFEFTHFVDTEDAYYKALAIIDTNEAAAMDLLTQVQQKLYDNNGNEIVNTENYADAQRRLAFYHADQGDYAQATVNFDSTIAKFHGGNPSLFLGAAQAHHRRAMAKADTASWRKCIEYARDAYRYKNSYESDERLEQGAYALYIEALCRHDSYFQTQTANRGGQSGDVVDPNIILGQIIKAWETYINNAPPGREQDAKTRLMQAQNEKAMLLPNN
ncbi:MAG: hypothetical protein GKR89_36805 [Candidatus Latescibacteria bacterium]|nr:hypothetical protein [Candidatus Latescibacterota bacterium]